MKTITIKRLYKGLASPRDVDLEACVENNVGVRLYCKENNQYMTLTAEQVKKGFQTVQTKFTSMYGTKPYKLVDFRWKADESDAKNQMDFVNGT